MLRLNVIWWVGWFESNTLRFQNKSTFYLYFASLHTKVAISKKKNVFNLLIKHIAILQHLVSGKKKIIFTLQNLTFHNMNILTMNAGDTVL